MGNCIFCIKPKNSQKNGEIPQLIPSPNNMTILHKHDQQRKENKKNIIIKTNPANMKLVGVPKSWLSKKYCDGEVIDETQMVEDDLEEEGIEENESEKDLTMSISSSSNE